MTKIPFNEAYHCLSDVIDREDYLLQHERGILYNFSGRNSIPNLSRCSGPVLKNLPSAQLFCLL